MLHLQPARHRASVRHEFGKFQLDRRGASGFTNSAAAVLLHMFGDGSPALPATVSEYRSEPAGRWRLYSSRPPNGTARCNVARIGDLRCVRRARCLDFDKHAKRTGQCGNNSDRQEPLKTVKTFESPPLSRLPPAVWR